MLELRLWKNNKQDDKDFGKYYARVDQKETINVEALAKHMAEHNTPFSVGTIKGILTDAVSCIRELTLEGKAVKIDNLAIFTVHCSANGILQLKDIVSQIGDKLPAAVRTLRLAAQATGDYSRDELNKYGRLTWTDAAQAQIDAAKNA